MNSSILSNMPTVLTTDAAVDAYEKSKLPALTFTREISSANPKLIGENMQSLVYALFAGIDYKEQALFASIRNYLNANTVNNGSFVIQYAKVLQQSESIVNFEPVIQDLVPVMRAWSSIQNVSFNGKTYEATFFKPICYNNCGENIYTLIPYIAFVLTFLLNGSPYRFMSSYYENKGFAFLSLLDGHLNKGYRDLAKDLNININTNTTDFSFLDRLFRG